MSVVDFRQSPAGWPSSPGDCDCDDPCRIPNVGSVQQCWREIADFKKFLQEVLTDMGIGSAIVAATAPSNPNMGQLWFDTVNKMLKTWDGTQWNMPDASGA